VAWKTRSTVKNRSARRKVQRSTFWCAAAPTRTTSSSSGRNWATITFLRHSSADVALHTEAILQQPADGGPLVLIKETTQREFEGGTQIFHLRPRPARFLRRDRGRDGPAQPQHP
jgi:UTP:GlnB (protein PII) uridylyltransferase